jgi:parallel beta-helix repeat protein
MTMRRYWPVLIIWGVVLVLISAGAPVAAAADISGTISSTLTVFDDSQLVGDVTCTVVGAPCIRFGADHITLRLNGFTITGLADPALGCGPTSATAHSGEDGIDTAGHSYLQILGPGLVQNFRAIGVDIRLTSTKVRVSKVTTSGNCICGIGLFGNASDNDVEENVVVRIGKNNSPCGGINIGTNNNRVRRNVIGGNGYAGGSNSTLNFGINIAGTENLVEENAAVGNTNGIRLTSTASNNVVRRNIVTGNPPLQDSETFGAGGVDILNLSTHANAFNDNLCLTSNVGGLCPNIPNFAGHKNGDEGVR